MSETHRMLTLQQLMTFAVSAEVTNNTNLTKAMEDSTDIGAGLTEFCSKGMSLTSVGYDNKGWPASFFFKRNDQGLTRVKGRVSNA